MELFVLGALYILPLVIAIWRDSKRIGGVLVVNLFLGWTLIGWVVALAWAAGSDKADRD